MCRGGSRAPRNVRHAVTPRGARPARGVAQDRRALRSTPASSATWWLDDGRVPRCRSRATWSSPSTDAPRAARAAGRRRASPSLGTPAGRSGSSPTSTRRWESEVRLDRSTRCSIEIDRLLEQWREIEVVIPSLECRSGAVRRARHRSSSWSTRRRGGSSCDRPPPHGPRPRAPHQPQRARAVPHAHRARGARCRRHHSRSRRRAVADTFRPTRAPGPVLRSVTCSPKSRTAPASTLRIPVRRRSKRATSASPAIAARSSASSPRCRADPRSTRLTRRHALRACVVAPAIGRGKQFGRRALQPFPSPADSAQSGGRGGLRCRTGTRTRSAPSHRRRSAHRGPARRGLGRAGRERASRSAGC